MDLYELIPGLDALADIFFISGIILIFVDALIENIWFISRNNREAAKCLGFHSGNITGFCNCRSCPYHAQCQHYAPPASFKERLYKLGRRIKACFSR